MLRIVLPRTRARGRHQHESTPPPHPVVSPLLSPSPARARPRLTVFGVAGALLRHQHPAAQVAVAMRVRLAGACGGVLKVAVLEAHGRLVLVPLTNESARRTRTQDAVRQPTPGPDPWTRPVLNASDNNDNKNAAAASNMSAVQKHGSVTLPDIR